MAQPITPRDLHPKRWQPLATALVAAEPAVVASACRGLDHELRSYAVAGVRALELDVALAYRTALSSTDSTAVLPHDGPTTSLETVGATRARQGIALDDLLRAWRRGVNSLISEAHSVATQLDLPRRELSDFVESALLGEDVAAVVVARAHRAAARAETLQSAEARAAFVKSVLLGCIAGTDLTQQAEVFGVDPDRHFRAVRARPARGQHREAARLMLGVDGDRRPADGLLAVVDGDVAGFVPRAPVVTEEVVVGVGPPGPLRQVAESFRLASRALRTASSFGLSGTRDLTALGLLAAIVEDDDVSAALHERYLAPVEELDDGGDTLLTLRTYLAARMNVDHAAEELFIHPNTLRNRLARFTKLTGTDLHAARDLCELWWALEHAESLREL